MSSQARHIFLCEKTRTLLPDSSPSPLPPFITSAPPFPTHTLAPPPSSPIHPCRPISLKLNAHFWGCLWVFSWRQDLVVKANQEANIDVRILGHDVSGCVAGSGGGGNLSRWGEWATSKTRRGNLRRRLDYTIGRFQWPQIQGVLDQQGGGTHRACPAAGGGGGVWGFCPYVYFVYP